MRKLRILAVSVSLCLSIAFIFPHPGKTFPTLGVVDCSECHDGSTLHDDHNTQGCSICHDVMGGIMPSLDNCIACHVDIKGCSECHDGATLHDDHNTQDCSICHNVMGGIMPSSSKCTTCHPLGNPANCNLVDFHDPDMGATCFICHADCGSVETTTSITAVVDSDNDGITDDVDNCPDTPNGPDGGTCSEGTNTGDPCTIAGLNESECGTDGFCSMDQEDEGDGDGVGNICDNCPETPNGPDLGTCVKGMNGVVVGAGVNCTSDSDCESNETCDLEQGDSDENGVGDACEKYADASGDGKVDLADLAILKQEFMRSDCDEQNPCSSDFNGDGKVDLFDLVILKEQFMQ